MVEPLKELTAYKVVERGFAFTDRRFPSDRQGVPYCCTPRAIGPDQVSVTPCSTLSRMACKRLSE
jgi:hypothetical protein